MQTIAQALGFTKSGATRVVDRLEAKGMAKRAPSADDGRVCCVHITEAGEAMIAQVDADTQEQIAQVLAKIDPGMRQVLCTSLQTLVSAL